MCIDYQVGFCGLYVTPKKKIVMKQVTRLKCGGFILVSRFNHTMCDASGLFQFMKAITEFARGASSLSVLPVWQRELLDARDPPRVEFSHREYDEVMTATGGTASIVSPSNDMAHRSFFFGQAEMAAIRNSVPHHLRSCSTVFELLVACMWRCRTIALQPDPEEEMQMLSIVNARGRFNPPLPAGYYGNAFAFPAALASAGKLCGNPLGYALELVRKAKVQMTRQYLQSVADLMVTRGRPCFTTIGSFIVSNLTRAGFDKLDFGWGKPVFTGTLGGGEGPIPGLITFFIPGRNRDGEKGILVPIFLPVPAMERFVQALENILQGREAVNGPRPPFASASL